MAGLARTRPGRPYPLGATWDGAGVNFALFSEHATAVELCLFDERDPGRRDPPASGSSSAPTRSGTSTVPGPAPARSTATACTVPTSPRPATASTRPSCCSIRTPRRSRGRSSGSDAIFGYRVGDPDGDLARTTRDSAPYVPKSVVVDPALHVGGRPAAAHAVARTVIYEVHVKGFTARHPDVPPELRGHLRRPGLARRGRVPDARSASPRSSCCPCTTRSTEQYLVERGLTNYWGYNSIGFFAPDARYAARRADRGRSRCDEFKTMVKALHRAGIEVILDVVYNHTAEGNHLGPTLSFRGIDNAAYYRLRARGPRATTWTTPAAATRSNMTHPRTLQLIMDSLRYWVLEMHVDGFRFDLAAALARELHDVDRLSAFFDVIHQDPVISQVKLIAEPWDLGRGRLPGRQLPGRLGGVERRVPRHRPPLLEGRRGPGGRARLPPHGLQRPLRDGRPPARTRASTSSPPTTASPSPTSSRYNAKHNEANGEDNRDGTDDNRVLELRRRGPDRRPGDRRAPRAADPQLPGHALPVQGVPMLLRRRRDRADPARQQQRLLPGQRACRGSRGRPRDRPGAARVHAAPDPPPHCQPGLPPAARSSRAGASRARR